MIARLAKSARMAARLSRAFGEDGNPNTRVGSKYRLPGSEGSTDSLGANYGKKFGRKTLVSTYNPYEFSPFKLNKDRNNYLSGYSMAEAYNITFQGKASNTVRASMTQDNLVILMLVSVIIFLTYERYRSNNEFLEAFGEYMDAQLSEIKSYGEPAQEKTEEESETLH